MKGWNVDTRTIRIVSSPITIPKCIFIVQDCSSMEQILGMKTTDGERKAKIMSLECCCPSDGKDSQRLFDHLNP